MIRSIHIEGFKSISKQKVELGRVNCFIGANGAGKSNLLEAIGILGAAAGGGVDTEGIMRRGVRAGLPRLYKTTFRGEQIRPDITLSAIGDGEAEYRVSLLNPQKDQPAWDFKTEYLADESAVFVSRPEGANPPNLLDSAGLAALKVVEMPRDCPAALLLGTLQQYATYCPNTPTLRGTVPDPQPRPPVGLSGGRLAEAWQELRRLSPAERLDEVFELIGWAKDIDATDDAGDMLSPAVPRSQYVLRFTDRFMSAHLNTLSAYDASEGALYVLFAALLCLSPSSPRLFSIDNLDQALNPRLMARLAERLTGWIRTSSSSRQVLFTAHNPAVLDGLDLRDNDVRLFTVERNSSGHTTVSRVEMSDKLEALNRDYPLSRLWLGAVPNV
jgi:predicted ATPase